MARRASLPPRPGAHGRRPGGKNKVTLEREHIAERILELARQTGKTADSIMEGAILAAEVVQKSPQAFKLPKEILADFATVFMSMAATYQPKNKDGVLTGGNPDEFERWALHAVDAAAKAADFYSPRMKALMVAPPPEISDNSGKPKVFTLNIFDYSGREVQQIDMEPSSSTRN